MKEYDNNPDSSSNRGIEIRENFDHNLISGLYTGGGVNLPWFWVRTCGWTPRTPPNSHTMLSEKHIYFPYPSKIDPIHDSNFTHSYTFWVKKIPH